MKTAYSTLLFAFVVSFAAATAYAHDTWIETGSGTVPVERSANAKHVGMNLSVKLRDNTLPRSGRVGLLGPGRALRKPSPGLRARLSQRESDAELKVATCLMLHRRSRLPRTRSAGPGSIRPEPWHWL